jgi:hypothetical protein
VQSRGIAVLTTGEYSALAPRANEHVRFYRTLTPQFHAAS